MKLATYLPRYPKIVILDSSLIDWGIRVYSQLIASKSPEGALRISENDGQCVPLTQR